MNGHEKRHAARRPRAGVAYTGVSRRVKESKSYFLEGWPAPAGQVVGLAELLVRERRRVAGAGAQTHDATALGVGRDQQGTSGARAGVLRRPPREAADLLGVGDVAAEQEDSTHA